MGDFSTPDQLNPDEIEPSKSNFIKPGKRPQSSISPVIFTDENGRVRLIAGASGGPLITTAVSLVSNARVHSPVPELPQAFPARVQFPCGAG